jgi:DNA-binding transcriptional regulator YdaS (Cro superfamily)
MKSITCVSYFGGKRQTAEALGLSSQAVHQWRDVVPLASAYKAQVISEGKILVQISLYGRSNKHM